jgi:hypothetical protein
MNLRLNVFISKISNFNRQKLLLLVLILLIPSHSHGSDERKLKLNPIHFQLQYAGNIGLLSAGIGKSFLTDKVNCFLIYGYLPENIHGATVHTIALKTSCKFSNTTISPVFNLDYYAGALILYGITDNTYLVYPNYYPDDYYNSNAIHASFYIGTRLNKTLPCKKMQKISFFTELGTIDYQFWNAITNKTIGILEIWNFCFGIAITIF